MAGNAVLIPVESEIDPKSPKTEDELDTSAEGKSHRPRKKHLYDQLLKQLEFYLGDANLSKDRFLSQKIRENPQLPVDLFLSFNKIRNYTCDVRDLVIALKKSNLLELTDDDTKVFRKTEVQKRENQDECTIYVENLPTEAHHDWLNRIFLSYGNVLYVSIPKYRNSRRNKGFAFIEFDSPTCVTKVLEAFGAAGCRLSADMPSENLLSIKTFEDDQGRSLYQNSASAPLIPKISTDIPTNTEDKHEEVLGKRKRSSIDTVSIIDDSKKSKLCESGIVVDASQKLNTCNDGDSKPEVLIATSGDVSMACRLKAAGDIECDTNTADRDSVDMDQDSSDGDLTAEEKKRKARNRKNKKGKKKHNLEVSSLGLQVLSKREWKRLRNKYLNSQREKMAALKQQVFEARLQAAKEKNEHLVDNTHQNGKDLPTYTFTEAVILKHEPDDYIDDISLFKAEARDKEGVAYVDIVPERRQVYIRCESAQAATKLLASNPWPNTSLLQGEEEKAYWHKISEDREAKLQKKRGKDRGRGKLLQRASKFKVQHTHFPDEEEPQQHNEAPTNKAEQSTAASSQQRQHIHFDDDDEPVPVATPAVAPEQDPAEPPASGVSPASSAPQT